jgi:hypothetical protein
MEDFTLGGFKEREIEGMVFDPECDEWIPVEQDLTRMQLQSAMGYAEEVTEYVEALLHRMKYYGETPTRGDMNDILLILKDLKRTLE